MSQKLSRPHTTKTLWSQFETTSRKCSEKTAIVHESRELSYSALALLVNSLTSALSTLNLAPGERIALIASKTPESVAFILAALHIRVVLVVINPLLQAPQIKHILDNSETSTLVCDSRTVEKLCDGSDIPSTLRRIVLTPRSFETSNQELLSSHSIELHHWSQFINSRTLVIGDQLQPPCDHDLALILYTSGSTGKPKGVMLSHANVFYGALSVSTYLENSENDRILALMPLSFDYGLSQLTSSIVSGATLVLYDYVVPRALVKTIVDLDITGVPAVPHVWDQLVKIEWPEAQRLRYITNTGGKLHTSTIKQLMKKLPQTTLYSMYGFTEAFRASYLPPDALTERPTSIGKSVPFASVLVVDDDGKECSPFEHGEIIQSGHLVSQGYWKDPIGTASKFRYREIEGESGKKYAWSGDIGYTDNDGYIYFVSRKDDITKLNGHRVSPSEIETSLMLCNLIDEVSVISIPDVRFGNVAVAFVVLSVPADTRELSQWSKKKLPSYMVPAQWKFLDKLPLTPNNKVDKIFLSSLLDECN